MRKQKYHYWFFNLFLIGIGLVFVVTAITHNRSRNTESKPTNRNPDTTIASVPPAQEKELQVSDIDKNVLLELTNKHRTVHSVKALVVDPRLEASALAKCNDMVKRDYWSHNDPSGVTPWHFFTEAGRHYTLAGENLFFGKTITAEEIIEGWSNSPEHNKNLLSSSFGNVGFGVCKSNNYQKTGSKLIVVQHLAD